MSKETPRRRTRRNYNAQLKAPDSCAHVASRARRLRKIHHALLEMTLASNAPASIKDAAIRKALAKDVAVIQQMVHAAYAKYIDRLRTLPAPMTADYHQLAQSGNLYVLEVNGLVAGSILLAQDGDAIKVDNLVVDPSMHGSGLGRLLMEYAENAARDQGFAALTLFTNEKMHENIALYSKTGFMETARKCEDGFHRVYFRKNLR